MGLPFRYQGVDITCRPTVGSYTNRGDLNLTLRIQLGQLIAGIDLKLKFLIQSREGRNTPQKRSSTYARPLRRLAPLSDLRSVNRHSRYLASGAARRGSLMGAAQHFEEGRRSVRDNVRWMFLTEPVDPLCWAATSWAVPLRKVRNASKVPAKTRQVEDPRLSPILTATRLSILGAVKPRPWSR